MKTYKSDQLVIPIPLPDGLAIREIAGKESYAPLLRKLITDGLKANAELDTAFQKARTRFSLLSDLQLLQLKSSLNKKPNKLS